MTRRIFFATSVWLAVAVGGHLNAADSSNAAPKTVRLLTVGNSFSHNAIHYLGDLAKASGNTLILHEANIGGATMEQHWAKAQQAESNPQGAEGKYSTGRTLKQELEAEKWDYVTIQQASIKSHDVATYQPFATELRDYIRKYAPGAEVVLHETWEYRVDDPRFKAAKPAPGEPATQDAMYEGLAASYQEISGKLGLRLLKVGDAFHAANHDPAWGFKADTAFDIKTAKKPALPNQTHSLNMGWQWKKQTDGSEKLTMDGHHANIAGEYLGACVWFEGLFGQSVVGNSFAPKGLSAVDAKFLQETAHRAQSGDSTRK